MGPTWGQQDVGPMNLAIRDVMVEGDFVKFEFGLSFPTIVYIAQASSVWFADDGEQMSEHVIR